ncbi:MAG: S8/S53 family peptidase [Planctomycetes bacterium]|nr:S8/S53 family peptidase [Planctomycetota bacterium]
MVVLVRSQEERPLPGSLPGTERWLVWLQQPEYDLTSRLVAIRSAPDRLQRRALVAELQSSAQADQAALTALVTARGGQVLQHYWVLRALAVEVPPDAVAVLRENPRVGRVVPVVARGAAEVSARVALPVSAVPPLPLGFAIDANNHNVARARTILTSMSTGGGGGVGTGARVAFFDTGIDVDVNGSNGGAAVAHPGLSRAGSSRLDASLLAQVPLVGRIDCNNISFVGAPGNMLPSVNGTPVAYRPCLHSTSAQHGTAMAGIAVGNSALGLPDGHAPDAQVVDVSISEGVSAILPIPDSDIMGRWTVNDATMLNAIQELRAWMLETMLPVHVLNVSFDGWSVPTDPIPTAFDEMALQDDVLIVTSCGNVPDDTRISNGFYNGLAVGAVHARTAAIAAFVPMAETSRGPLASDTRRFYPDLCATGAGSGLAYGDAVNQASIASFLQMPAIDVLDACATQAASPTTCIQAPPCGAGGVTLPAAAFGLPVSGTAIRLGRGTSEAAAQVSGAAALYRSARPTASAEETRAAILLNLISAYPNSGPYPPQPSGLAQHTYAGRNTFGLGYLRDDLLAEFAARGASPMGASSALHQQVAVTATTAPTVQYPVTAGLRYAVAICWPRIVANVVPQDLRLLNLDLEVAGSNGAIVARSVSLANNYERVGFTAANTETLTIRVLRVETPAWLGSVPVQVVAREFNPDADTTTTAFEATPTHAGTGGVISLPSGSPATGCAAPAQSIVPVRTVPGQYESAYGSGPLAMVPGPSNTFGPPLFRGISLAQTGSNGPSGCQMRIEINGNASAGQPNGSAGGPALIGGIAFRSWLPFEVTGPLSGSIVMENTPPGGVNATVGVPVPPGSLFRSPGTTAVNVGNFNLPGTPTSWVGTSFQEFSFVVPFTTPFSYAGGGPNGSNLSIWIFLTGPIPTLFRVDSVADGPDAANVFHYGCLTASQGPGPAVSLGCTPVFALLPAAPTPLPTLTPLLRVIGEPLLGNQVEVQLSQVAAGSATVLVLGTWSPGAFVPFPGCTQHIVAPFFTTVAAADQIGFVRWPLLTVPATPSWIHVDFGVQAMSLLQPSGAILSNGVRVVVGGGL